MNNKPSQYDIVEHIWRLGRWALGMLVIILWGAPWTVYVAYVALGTYEQFHGKICRGLEKLLKYKVSHNEWD